MGWQEWSNFLGPSPRMTRTIYTQPEMGEEALGGLSSLVSSYNRAYGAAKSANEARYRQLLQIANQTTQQRAADIRSDYGRQQAGAMQNLARLGMSGTTIAPTLQMGYKREQQSALNRLADTMQQTKLGIIERRTDAYPEQSALMQLVQSIGGAYGTGGLSSALTALGKMRY